MTAFSDAYSSPNTGATVYFYLWLTSAYVKMWYMIVGQYNRYMKSKQYFMMIYGIFWVILAVEMEMNVDTIFPHIIFS